MSIATESTVQPSRRTGSTSDAAAATVGGADLKLYESVRQKIEGLIAQGTLRPGDKVPSVRKLSEQLGVSVSTVLQAYRLLEDLGKIKAKPQSGYYVSTRLWQPPAEPEISSPKVRSTPVAVNDLVLEVFAATRHPDIVPLGAAIPGPDTLPIRKLNRMLGSVLRRSPTLGSEYDMPPGSEALRVQIARRALDTGCTLSPDQIMTTVGAQEAIGLCLRAVAKAGDTIAIESPSYYGILQLIETLGMKALEIPTHPRDGVSIEALRLALDETRVKACLFVPNYQNPLGCVMPDANKKELVELLAEREIPLIEDDIYGDLGFAGERPKVCKAFDTKGLVLLCSSYSKTLAAGYRVGWCVPGRFAAEVTRLKLVTTLATPSLPQRAVAEFLASGGYDHHLRAVRRTYQQQVERMQDAVCEFFPAETRATRPAGGFVLWVELPEKVDALTLHRQALDERISIAPGPIFSAKQRYRHFVRLNCAVPWSNDIERAMRTLGRLINDQLK